MESLQQKKDYIEAVWRSRCVEFPWLQQHTIFLSIHGSTAYGLNTDTSDVDMTGVCIPPAEYFLGFLRSLEQIQFNKPDGQIYSLLKFFRLALDNNPNVMELLWIDPKYHIISGSTWDLLWLNKEKFLSKKARFTYAGYAHAQLARIKTHRKWLLNPPPGDAPTRQSFGLPPERIMSRDAQGALDQLVAERKVTVDDNFMARLQKENELDRAKKDWHMYQNWKKTRNPIRAHLEEKFGYDTKHAAHLVRLIRQGTEILTKHTLDVERKEDREELLGIRGGIWTYDQLMEWVDKEACDEVLNKLYEASALPRNPDREFMNNLCCELVAESIKKPHKTCDLVERCGMANESMFASTTN